jgi:hypothetical protein
MECSITVKLDGQMSTLGLPTQALIDALGTELSEFEDWFTKNGNHPLINIERSILTSFLIWKLHTRLDFQFLSSEEPKWTVGGKKNSDTKPIIVTYCGKLIGHLSDVILTREDNRLTAH